MRKRWSLRTGLSTAKTDQQRVVTNS
jgi:hypothetical protein